jgi:hypothetical protein
VSPEHARIVKALQNIQGISDIQETPYGEVSWKTANQYNSWLAKTWSDFCGCLGSMAEIGVLKYEKPT